MRSEPSAETLAELIRRRARETPDSVFLEDARAENRHLTFAGLGQRVDDWCRALDARGLPSGAPVIVAVRDPLSFAVVYLAVIASGRRCVPINPDLPDGEPARSASLVGGAALVVVGADQNPVASVDWSSVVVGPDGRAVSWDVVAGTNAGSVALPDGGAAVLFTSGSTGTPKGVELSERQLLYVARAIAQNNRLTSTDRGYNSLPMFHINAEVVGLLSSLVAGSTLVFDAAFHRTGFWQTILEREITWLNAVPAILAVLTRDGEPIPRTRLRFIRSASAPLPDGVRNAVGRIPLVLSWGMTEGASQITATPIGDTAHPGSAGRPLGAEVEVRAPDGRLLGPGLVGALWIRGEGIVTRYLFDRASDRFDAAGWLNTGDLGSLDADGYVYLAGRSDDVINRGGEKVYPAEVEDVLLGDRRVLEAVVVARPDDILGSVPVAYVILVDREDAGGDSLVDDLRKRCEAELPRFKRPVEIALVPDLPRASTGKVQRSKVRKLAVQ